MQKKNKQYLIIFCYNFSHKMVTTLMKNNEKEMITSIRKLILL